MGLLGPGQQFLFFCTSVTTSCPQWLNCLNWDANKKALASCKRDQRFFIKLLSDGYFNTPGFVSENLAG
jgi:hypothetical protein